MKYIYLFMFFELLLFLSLKAGTEDSFAAPGTVEWKTESLEEKPYRIEILYGEHEKEFPDDINSTTYREVEHSESLKSFTRLFITTSASETGEVEEDSKYKLEYKISEGMDELFDLNLYFRTVDPNSRNTELKTKVMLKESHWHVFSGLTRQAEDGSELLYTIAIRIVERANQL